MLFYPGRSIRRRLSLKGGLLLTAPRGGPGTSHELPRRHQDGEGWAFCGLLGRDGVARWAGWGWRCEQSAALGVGLSLPWELGGGTGPAGGSVEEVAGVGPGLGGGPWKACSRVSCWLSVGGCPPGSAMPRVSKHQKRRTSLTQSFRAHRGLGSPATHCHDPDRS